VKRSRRRRRRHDDVRVGYIGFSSAVGVRRIGVEFGSRPCICTYYYENDGKAVLQRALPYCRATAASPSPCRRALGY